MVALSLLLGLAFNAANPLGVRWTEPNAVTPSAPTLSPASFETHFRAPAPVTWAQTRPLVAGGEVLLVDARSQAAFDAGHIPGAVLLPEGSADPELTAFRAQYGTNRYVVVYCSSTGCSISFKLAYKLAKDYGFTEVDYMTGGYFEYQREHGLATGSATSSSEATPVDSTRVESAPLPVAWTKAATWLDRGEAVLVDARSDAEFGFGHLPGAVSLPVASDGRQLAAFAERVGTNRMVVVYGASVGSLATLDHACRLARELPLRGVRFLPDGYRELALLPRSATNAPATP